jgi:histidinol-phosphate phosphatase family protein
LSQPPGQPSGRAVFLDRDGVINRHLPGEYVRNWSMFDCLDGVPEAIRKLEGAGFAVVVVTNQQGIGKGLMTEEDLEDIHRKMEEELARRGSSLDGIYHCPHLAESGCRCRKPEPGLVRRAARDLGLDTSRSYLAGDSLSDAEAARRAGCRPVLLGGRVKPVPPDCLAFPDLLSFATALALAIDRGEDGL